MHVFMNQSLFRNPMRNLGVSLILVCWAALPGGSLLAQRVGVGTTNPDSNAILELAAGPKGLLIPRMSTGNRDSIAAPAEGLTVYDSTTHSFWFWANGSWREIPDARPDIVVGRNPEKFIADLDTVRDTILLADAGFLEEGAGVLVRFNITHTYDGDLSIWLKAPSGLMVSLSEQNGGSGDNYVQTALCANGLYPINAASAPFTGLITAEGDMTAFAGESIAGPWILVIYDGFNFDTGILHDWELSITPRSRVSRLNDRDGDTFVDVEPTPDADKIWVFTAGQLRMEMDTAGYVGIGVQGPKNRLDVKGGMSVGAGYAGHFPAPNNGLIIENRLGVGTENPNARLHLYRNVNALTIPLMLQNENTTINSSNGLMIGFRSDGATAHNGGLAFRRTGSSGVGNLYFLLNQDPALPPTLADSKLTILANGKVGVGTNTPVNRMDVGGTLAIGSGYAGVDSLADNRAIIEGKVGVGTFAPVNALDVKGGAAIGANFAGEPAPTNQIHIEERLSVGSPMGNEIAYVNGSVAMGNQYVNQTVGQQNSLVVQGRVGIGTLETDSAYISISRQVGDTGPALEINTPSYPGAPLLYGEVPLSSAYGTGGYFVGGYSGIHAAGAQTGARIEALYQGESLTGLKAVVSGAGSGKRYAVYGKASSGTLNYGGYFVGALNYVSGAFHINGTDNSAKLNVQNGTAAIGSAYAGVNTAPDGGMVVQGRVGVGTSMPDKGKLQINGSVTYNPGSYAWLDNQGNFNFNNNYFFNEYPYSLHAGSRIAASEINAYSDGRIKTVLGQTDNEQDLATLLGIAVTDYKLRDDRGAGGKVYKKVIAQQVRDVFPAAVETRATGTIPDIMAWGFVQAGWIEMPNDLAQDDRVEVILAGSAVKASVLEAEPTRFRLDTTTWGPLLQEGDSIFIYGRFVRDLHAVDYQALSMLNVSAIQAQQDHLEGIDNQLGQLSADLNTNHRMAASLRERIARLETHANPNGSPIHPALTSKQERK